eukprot:7959781-Alexandrium_andersonii.AAC.1
MGLYGAEPTAVPDGLMRRVHTQVIKAADGRLSACRNPDAALEAFAELEREVGPAHWMCERR